MLTSLHAIHIPNVIETVVNGSRVYITIVSSVSPKGGYQGATPPPTFPGQISFDVVVGMH